MVPFRGLGFGQENAKEKAKNMGDKAGDAASVATERLRTSTFGSCNYLLLPYSFTDEVINKSISSSNKYLISCFWVLLYVFSTYASLISQMAADTDSVHDNFDPSIRMPTDTIDNAKETVTRAMGSGMDRAANAYDEANNTMNRATGAASDKAYDAMEYGKDRTAKAYDGA